MTATGPIVAAVGVHEQVTIHDITTGTVVPWHPRARLMYYLSSVNSVLELPEDELPQRLTKYSNYK